MARYLEDAGHEVIPVNPNYQEIDEMKSYPGLESISKDVDVVDIFRRSEYVVPAVDVAMRKGAKVIWMQEGVVNKEAAIKARQAGLKVVMDRCMMKEHHRLIAHETGE